MPRFSTCRICGEYKLVGRIACLAIEVCADCASLIFKTPAKQVQKDLERQILDTTKADK